MPWLKEVLPLGEHSAHISDSTSWASGRFHHGHKAIYPHSTAQAKALLRLFHITWLQWSQDSQVAESRFSFSAPLCSIPLPMSSQGIPVHWSSGQLSHQPWLLPWGTESAWNSLPSPIYKQEKQECQKHNQEYPIHTSNLMTLIIFPKSLHVRFSHGHPQSVFMSTKTQPYTHKSREMKNMQKSTRVSQELMVGVNHLRGLFQGKWCYDPVLRENTDDQSCLPLPRSYTLHGLCAA